MISYDPLLKTLKERNMTISDLRGVVLDGKTIAKFNKGESLKLSTVERICKFLKVPIEKVVYIEYK
ncbi:helix-turn-helix transcriptional regulator [Fictibacillus sp. Mic-4]|uniref:helix-turn-helix domain-containing protein n=1 Tax=Fictibacillus sp. Mic-4 TaxID=3132826 RepID=UPI003CF82713